MPRLIPISAWASSNGLTRDHALNLARAGKIPGAAVRKTILQRWYVPADARADLTDRRRKDVRERGSAIARSA